MQPCVYILTNDNKTTLYVGVTSDIGEGDAFTRRYGLHKLVFVEYHTTMIGAIAREKQLKSWSRNRKDELIRSINPLWKDFMLDGDL